MSGFYQDCVTRAGRLSMDELRLAASPSLDTMHRCEDCFPCACVQVMENIQRHNHGKWRRRS